MSKILDNLYLGSYADAKNQTLLINLGITHIVTVGIELKTLYPRLFKYLYIPAHDSPEFKLIIHFDEIADFIHNAMQKKTGKVFVHCYWGISRSTTSIIAYLIKYQNMNPTQAKQFIKQKREIIYPNEGFMKQLETFAKKIVPKTKKVVPRYLQDSKVKEYMTSNDVSESYRAKFPSLARSSSLAVENKITPKAFDHKKSVAVGLEAEVRIKELRNTLSRRGTVLRPLKSKNPLNTKRSTNDFACKECGIKLFNSSDILHNSYQEIGSRCNAIYLRSIPWLRSMNANVGKVCCPNSKCNKTVGYADKDGGACSCGKPIKTLFIIYPMKVSDATSLGSEEI